MVKDTIGMLFVTAFVITFFTNAITDWNLVDGSLWGTIKWLENLHRIIS